MSSVPELDTFSHITGVQDKELAKKYLDTAWNALKYLTDNYTDKVFLGIGIPYNKDLISLDEVRKMGEKIYEEMVNVWNVLTGTGLKTVICQTAKGHIGPVL